MSGNFLKSRDTGYSRQRSLHFTAKCFSVNTNTTVIKLINLDIHSVMIKLNLSEKNYETKLLFSSEHMLIVTMIFPRCPLQKFYKFSRKVFKFLCRKLFFSPSAKLFASGVGHL